MYGLYGFFFKVLTTLTLATSLGPTSVFKIFCINYTIAQKKLLSIKLVTHAAKQRETKRDRERDLVWLKDTELTRKDQILMTT